MTTHYIVKMKLQPKWQNGVLQRSFVEVQSGSVVLWKSPYRRSGVEDTWWPVERREGEERNTYIIHTEIRRPPSESTYRNMLSATTSRLSPAPPSIDVGSSLPPSAPRLSFFVSLEERRLFLIHLSLRPLRRHRRRRLVA